jgi:O-antigen ligase
VSTQVDALPVRRGLGVSVATLADGAAFGVLLAAVAGIPVTFSIANADVFAMPKTIVAVGLAVLLLLLLGVRWIAIGARVRDLRSNPLAWALTAFVGWNLLAFPFAVDPGHALIGEPRQFQGLVTTLVYPVYLLAAWTTLRAPWRRTMLLAAMVLGALVVAGYAIVQGADLDPIWTNLDEDDRAFSTIGQANALAAYLVIALPLTLGLAIRRALAVQLFLAALVVLELVALAFTLSRGGFLGMAIVTVVLVVTLWPRRRALISRRGLGVAASTALVAALVVVALPDARAGAERALDRVFRPGGVEEASTSAHVDQWAVGVAIVADHPLVGVGQDSYALRFADYRDEVLEPDRARVWRKYRPESPHNHYLAIAGGAGLPALAAYLAIVGLAVLRAGRGMRDAAEPRTWLVGAVLLAAIAGHLVTDGFMTAETTGSVLFWIVLGAAAAMGPRPSASSSRAAG